MELRGRSASHIAISLCSVRGFRNGWGTLRSLDVELGASPRTPAVLSPNTWRLVPPLRIQNTQIDRPAVLLLSKNSKLVLRNVSGADSVYPFGCLAKVESIDR
jgi:hypothetical protein